MNSITDALCNFAGREYLLLEYFKVKQLFIKQLYNDLNFAEF